MYKAAENSPKRGDGAVTMPVVAEPVKLRKRIGSTTFLVTIRFSETTTETAEDKILRIIEREVLRSA